jgi:hypothetical protein
MDADCGGDAAQATLCDVDNEWAEFWDIDEWDSGCISQMASFYDEETLLDADMTDEPVYECITCLEETVDAETIYQTMFGACTIGEPCTDDYLALDPVCSLCAITTGTL